MIDKYTGRTPEILKLDREVLVEALREVNPHKDLKIRGSNMVCPFCEDIHPSAGIFESRGTGFWRFKCNRSECGWSGTIIDVIGHVDGIDGPEVCRMLGNGEIKSSTPPAIKKPDKVFETIEDLSAVIKGNVQNIHLYKHEDTEAIEHIVIRYVPTGADKKQFTQARPVEGGYSFGAPEQPWGLYGRNHLKDKPMVVVVEGERCVEALHRQGITATTSPGGAGKASLADWGPLSGKQVILWPDNDSAGIEHMAAVCEIIRPYVKSLHVIDPTSLGLPDKGDCIDFIAKQNRNVSTALVNALDTARPPKSPADEVGQLMEDIISGKIVCVPWKWPLLSALTKSLIPENVIIVCGGLGASKSFKALELADHWHKAGIKVAIYELEESRKFHLLRSLAQTSGTSNLTDYDWIRANPEQARSIFQKYEEALGSFGLQMKATPEVSPTLDEVGAWIEEKAKTGHRLIIVDPITAVTRDDNKQVWNEDRAFVNRVKRAATQYLCSIILVTHPTKAGNVADLAYISGGAAYEQLAQTILWLEAHEDKSSDIQQALHVTESMEHNRTIHILKARHGPGQFKRLAYSFSRDSLQLSELGLIISKKQEKR